MSVSHTAEVAIVGGGPAGAAAAIRLASAGVEVALFERLAAPHWRAAGVYSSPATRGHLAALGLAPDQVEALIRPIDTMEVVGPSGIACRLGYPSPDHACGLDRVRLERALLDRAAAAGAQVLEAAVVRDIRPAQPTTALDVSTADGVERWAARLVVGADGPGSLVARSVQVARPIRRLRQAGLTMHRIDPEAAPFGTPMTARMTIGRGWYCGVAPVPGGRVNIGIVMGGARLRERLRAVGSPAAVAREVLETLPAARAAAWQREPNADRVCVALPLAQRVVHRAGPGWLLVGDAAGFIDPLSGDGLHRAFASSELAAEAVTAWRLGRPGALERYHRRMRGRFAARDVVSWVLQVLLARPQLLDYAIGRLARRDQLRWTFGRALADLEPAGRLLEPRFIAGLLRP